VITILLNHNRFKIITKKTLQHLPNATLEPPFSNGQSSLPKT